MINLGVNIISDNWLMQYAADVLDRSRDPISDASILDCTSKGLRNPTLRLGTLQVECLVSLIEQIMFCDRIYVLEDWIYTWTKRIPDLDDLLKGGMITPVHIDQQHVQDMKKIYLKELCNNPHIKNEHETASEIVSRGEWHFNFQIIDGVASYLAISNVSGYCYCPHPARAAFLKKSLWYLQWPNETQTKFNQLVNSSRIKLYKAVGHDSELINLIYRISSVSLLCIRESSSQISPLNVARQFRDNSEIKHLRKVLHEMSVALAKDDIPANRASCKLLEDAILEVERKLKIRHLNDRDGPKEIPVFGFHLKVPDFLRRPLRPPEHSGIILNLIKTGSYNISHLLSEKLGINSKEVIQELVRGGSASLLR